MSHSPEPLSKLAAVLSPAARELLLADGEMLRRRNEETRRFIEAFRVPHPLRVAYARSRAEVRVDEEPRALALDQKDRELLRALHFHPSAVNRGYEGTKVERWIGPDGAIVLEMHASPGGKRFLICVFDDDTKIAIWPDVSPLARELQGKNLMLETSGSLFEDYALMLELVARRVRQAGARPLYRYEDPELDAAALAYYERFQVPMGIVKHAHKLDVTKWVNQKSEKLLDGAMDWSRKHGLETVDKLGRWARVDEDGLVIECPTCNAKNRVPVDRLGQTARCAGCKEDLPTTSFPIDATPQGLGRLLNLSPIPVLVDFWAPWCGPCLVGMPGVIEAAKQSDGRYAIARVDGDQYDTQLRFYDLRAFPTMIRFVDGAETGRSMGVKQTEQIVKFAVENDVPPGPSI